MSWIAGKKSLSAGKQFGKKNPFRLDKKSGFGADRGLGFFYIGKKLSSPLEKSINGEKIGVQNWQRKQILWIFSHLREPRFQNLSSFGKFSFSKINFFIKTRFSAFLTSDSDSSRNFGLGIIFFSVFSLLVRFLCHLKNMVRLTSKTNSISSFHLKRALFAKIPIYAELQNWATCHPCYLNIRSDFSARYCELLDFWHCTVPPTFAHSVQGSSNPIKLITPEFQTSRTTKWCTCRAQFCDYNAPLKSQNGERTTEKPVCKKFRQKKKEPKNAFYSERDVFPLSNTIDTSTSNTANTYQTHQTHQIDVIFCSLDCSLECCCLISIQQCCWRFLWKNSSFT